MSAAIAPRFSTAVFAQLTQARLLGADVEFTSVSTDTRTLTPGALFVALRGPNFDGHEYLAAALARGAVAALVEHECSAAIPQIVVPDSLQALSSFARAWRRQFTYPVIGVTGSNGKTTTKEILGSILNQSGSCLVTRGNLNNHIGVPLTLLMLNSSYQSAVIEMGANHLNEIAHLASMAEPVIGLITNAGAAHLEGFGGLDGVAQGKGELFLALPENGTAVMNADDRYFGYWRSRCKAENILSFGLDQPADFSAKNIVTRNASDGFETQFDLHTPSGVTPAGLHLAGPHNLRNALGASAAAFAAGATLADIEAGLNAMCPVGGRLQPKAAINGAALIDDSYNANPNSVKAGIDALCSVSGRHWLIFGEMREMGPDSPQMHREIGEYARSKGIERLLAVGSDAKHTVDTFGAGAQWFASLDELISEVRQSITAGVTVLIKGSRGNRLERATAALAAEPTQNTSH